MGSGLAALLQAFGSVGSGHVAQVRVRDLDCAWIVASALLTKKECSGHNAEGTLCVAHEVAVSLRGGTKPLEKICFLLARF